MSLKASCNTVLWKQLTTFLCVLESCKEFGTSKKRNPYLNRVSTPFWSQNYLNAANFCHQCLLLMQRKMAVFVFMNFKLLLFNIHWVLMVTLWEIFSPGKAGTPKLRTSVVIFAIKSKAKQINCSKRSNLKTIECGSQPSREIMFTTIVKLAWLNIISFRKIIFNQQFNFSANSNFWWVIKLCF